MRKKEVGSFRPLSVANKSESARRYASTLGWTHDSTVCPLDDAGGALDAGLVLTTGRGPNAPLRGRVRDGWGVSEVLAAFVTTLATGYWEPLRPHKSQG